MHDWSQFCGLNFCLAWFCCCSGLLEPGRVECDLCRVICVSALEMIEHLKSEHHIMKEKNLFSDDVKKDVSVTST